MPPPKRTEIPQRLVGFCVHFAIPWTCTSPLMIAPFGISQKKKYCPGVNQPWNCRTVYHWEEWKDSEIWTNMGTELKLVGNGCKWYNRDRCKQNWEAKNACCVCGGGDRAQCPSYHSSEAGDDDKCTCPSGSEKKVIKHGWQKQIYGPWPQPKRWYTCQKKPVYTKCYADWEDNGFVKQIIDGIAGLPPKTQR